MTYDLVIKNGKLFDGTGNPWNYLDLAVKDGKIAKVGFFKEGGEVEIDAKGKAVAPGFIDIHTHDDPFFVHDKASELLEFRVGQGTTTSIFGNCGISIAPLADDTVDMWKGMCGWMTPPGCGEWKWRSMQQLLDTIEKKGTLINAGSLIGHGAVRMAVMGMQARLSEPKELDEMKKLLEQSLKDGGFGLSVGLIYGPGMYSDTHELAELCKVVAKYKGVFTTHIRGSSETLLPAQREIQLIAEESGVRLQHSHNEAFGHDHWWKIDASLKNLEDSRRRGIDNACDMFPYTAAMTMMIAIYPPWALEGGIPGLFERLKDKKTREKILYDIEHVVPEWPTWPDGWPHNLVEATGWHNIYIGFCPSEKNKKYEGMNLVQLGEETGKTPFDAISDLMLEEDGAISQLIFGVSGDIGMTDRNDEMYLKKFIKHPYCCFETDASDIGVGKPHPSAWGNFARVLGRYARDFRYITMEEAVRKLTSFPASRFLINDRGLLKEGLKADITIFDPNIVMDNNTYWKPREKNLGFEYVIVNGQTIFDHGELNTKIKPGNVLRRQDYVGF